MTSSIREVFSPDDPVARFVVSVSAARNAIDPAAHRAAAANETGDPEFTSHVLALVGYLVEGVAALLAYRESSDDVRSLLASLPGEAQADLKLAVSVGQRVGAGVLDHSRDSSFHFPHPDRRRRPDSDAHLREVLVALQDEPASVVRIGDTRRVRLVFADRVMLALAMGKHAEEEDELRRQVAKTQDAAFALVRLVDCVVATYLARRRGRLTRKQVGP